jgi:phosphoribosyl-ATP pyrophosphohydrolase
MNRVFANRESINETDVGRAPLLAGAAPLAETTLTAGRERSCAGPGELDRLYAGLAGVTAESHPRTARLLGSGRRRAAQKIIEEAGEVALEAVKGRSTGIVRESADLLYHLVVLWRRAHIDPADVYAEMQRRADALGIAEKLPKAPGRCGSSRGSVPRR